jgi:hypothetical protein
LPVLVLLGSVTTSAVIITLCIKNLEIWLFARDAWRIDITVEPRRSAQMITLNLTFLLIKESAAKANAAMAIRHGAVAL